MSARNDHRHALRHGFSLIEVLIALVILSVGLLGLAALQAEGLRGSSSALQRLGAVNYAADIADRMRSNRQGLATYSVALGAPNPADAALACAEYHDGGTVNDCTATELAQYDVYRWKDEMEDRGYDGSVAPTGTNQFTIVVTWTDRTAASASAQSYTTVVQF